MRLAAEKGVLAGYPVVGLKATLLDGSYHPVDSSEMAFIMAAKLAYKAAMPEAGPVILEPIHTLKAHVPNDNTGDIMGDVTKRRGRVLGMEPDEDGLQTIIAEVPLAELANFTTFIRQTTQGRGWFTTEFARYEVLPEMLVPAVVEQAKKLGNLDESADGYAANVNFPSLLRSQPPRRGSWQNRQVLTEGVPTEIRHHPDPR